MSERDYLEALKEAEQDNIRLKKAILDFLNDHETGGYNSNSTIKRLKKVVMY